MSDYDPDFTEPPPDPLDEAYSDGFRAGAQAERERIMKIAEEVLQAAWDEGGYGRMNECNVLDALLDDIDKRLKQRIGAEK